MKVKEAKTFDEQIKILQRRGLKINNVDEAKLFLKNTNYYRFTAYLIDYKLNGKSEKNKSVTFGRDLNKSKAKIININRYKQGTDFEYIKNIYMFDQEIKNLILSILEKLEISFKTYIAYTLAHGTGPLGYLDYRSFLDDSIIGRPSINKKKYKKNIKQQHYRFMQEVKKSIRYNKDKKYIKHHKIKYEGNYPIWVLVEILTFGNISMLYSNLKKKDKQFIKNEMCNVPIPLTEQWIYMLSKLRNDCAHYERLYSISLPDILIHDRYKGKNYDKNSLFAYLLAIKDLIYSIGTWNDFISELNNIITKYYYFIDLKKIGFPEDWFEVLSK